MSLPNGRRRASGGRALIHLLLSASLPAASATPILLLGGQPKAPQPDVSPLSTGPLSGPGIYTLREAFIGHNFLSGFEPETFDDPTHGRVNYVDYDTAAAANLTYSTLTKFIMKADDKKVVPESARGRDSIRIRSKQTYKDGVFVLDISHLPQGCATWPAWWTVGSDWPSNGEIDIIEGVNDVGDNLSSLHTAPNCDMPASGRAMTGSTVSTSCDASKSSNEGCGVSFTGQPNSFGPSFNANGGGWYVMRRSPQSVAVWFFARNSPSVPLDVRLGLPVLDESGWGTPDAVFPTAQGCTLEGDGGVLGPHNMVFDLTFGGDWAGNAIPSNCPSNLVDFVNNQPAAFSEAYWEINGLRTYV